MTALALDVRELSFGEVDLVSGGDGFFGRVAGAVSGAACDLVTRGKAVVACAVAAVVVEEAVNSPQNNTGAYACAKIGDCSGLRG